MSNKSRVIRARDRQSVDDDDDEQQCPSAPEIQVENDSPGDNQVKRYRRNIKDDSDSDEWDEEEIKHSDDDDPKENLEEKQSIWQKLKAEVESFKSPSPIPEANEEDEVEVQENDDGDQQNYDHDDEEECQNTSTQDPDKGKTVKKKVEDLKKLFDQKKHTLENFQQRIEEAGADFENLVARRDVVNQELNLYQEMKQYVRDATTNNFEHTTSLENMNSLIKKCHGYKTGKIGSTFERGVNSPGKGNDEENIPGTTYETLKEELKLGMEKLRSGSKRRHNEVDEDEEQKEISDAEFFKNLTKKMKTESSNNNENADPCIDMFD